MSNLLLERFYKNPTLTDGFGSTKPPRVNPHRGLDFIHPLGAEVLALQDGLVVIQEFSEMLGQIVEIRHDSDGRFTGYRHMRTTGGPWVRKGQRVKKGEKIGEVSDTGYSAYGYHLCTTNSAAQGGVYGYTTRGLADPWPYIQDYVFNPNKFVAPPGNIVGAPLWPEGPLMKEIQGLLMARKRYTGPLDGKGGLNTAKAIQRTLNLSRKNGVIDGSYLKSAEDGILGSNNAYGIQYYARDFGDYDGPIDGKPLENSWVNFALGLKRP